MNSLKLSNRSVGYIVGALVMVLSPFMASLVSAGQVTERSIALSSSSAGATGVTYDIGFTAALGAGAFVVEFCSNSPLVTEVCTPPAGFTAAGAATTKPGYTISSPSATKFVVASTIGPADAVQVDVTGITNPTAAGSLYARIVTYDTAANAANYPSTESTDGARDQGSVAIAITNTVGVSGAVLESMLFCVSGATITKDCANANATPPTLKLGKQTGSVIALSPDEVSEGSIYTQISTNAASGAIVSLKSDAAGCGGLKRAGALATVCDIKPATGASGIAAGQARFGVKTADATDSAGAVVSGVLQPVGGSLYNNNNFALNYVPGDATGVTSVYGDPFLDTNSQPVNNKNMQLTFGASIANDTPAGNYSANLSLIATGKF